MNAQDLKNSILQLAVQGKLVEQRPEEGSAEELYQQIVSEKARLIKEGKIKKEKLLAEITDDEIPFDIPESWKWVRIGTIISLLSGQDFSPDKYSDIAGKTVYITGASNLSDEGVLVSRWTDFPKCFAYKGDILLVCKGSGYGKVVLCDVEEAHIARQIMAIKSTESLYMQYILFYLKASYSLLKSSGQGVIPGIDRDTVLNMMLPLPPLAEQKRIVAKIEEIFPYIKQYDKAHTKLETFNKKFPSDMKKSILQLAIQGKLVEQRQEEGTAEELYQQIVAEKARLIKEGKIKKEKPLDEITDDEIPFEIPESWKWVRIGDIFYLQAGKNISASNISETIVDKYQYPCFGGNGIRGYVEKSNKCGKYALIGRQGALCGNINIAEKNFYATEHAVVVEHFGCTDVEWGAYFLRALNLNQYATATAQPGLAVGNIVKVLIPLPPLAEQKRIVAKLEQMLLYCDKLAE